MIRNTILSAATIAALLAAASASAAIVTFNFDLFAQDSSLIGSGSFSYDDSVLDGAGNGEPSPVNGDLTLDAIIFGLPFDETNDIDFDTFPIVSVVGGVPTNLDYILDQAVNGVDFAGILFDGRPVIGVNTGGVLGVGDDGQLLINGVVETADVPAPAALALFGLGLIGLGAARRRG